MKEEENINQHLEKLITKGKIIAFTVKFKDGTQIKVREPKVCKFCNLLIKGTLLQLRNAKYCDEKCKAEYNAENQSEHERQRRKEYKRRKYRECYKAKIQYENQRRREDRIKSLLT